MAHPAGQRVLNRGTNREERVGNEVEPLDRFIDQRRRATRRDPAELHLWQGEDLRESAQDKGERLVVSSHRDNPLRILTKSIITEDLVDNHRQLVLLTDQVELLQLITLDERTGRIVGRDDDDRPDVTGDGIGYRLEIDAPAKVVIIAKLIGDEPDSLKSRQEVEERVAWLGDENRLPLIGKQFEEPRVSLAGAGREMKLSGICSQSTLTVVGDNSLASLFKPTWHWLIGE